MSVSEIQWMFEQRRLAREWCAHLRQCGAPSPYEDCFGQPDETWEDFLRELGFRTRGADVGD